MTIDKAALNREISEAIEPFETLPDAADRVVVIGDWSQSLKHAWMAVEIYAEGDVPRWQPRDWTGDDAASCKLLDMMHRSLLASGWPGCEGWRVDLGVAEYNGPPIGPTNIDRRTAVALAAREWLRSKR